MTSSAAKKLAEPLAARIRAGERAALSRGISYVESHLPQDQEVADELLAFLMSFTGKSKRIGITGIPGVGKSSFIETLGMARIQQGESLAVLAIDPTSPTSGGSILGDKTRMTRLSGHPKSFVRSSPSKLRLGGVSEKTREAIFLLEASGYETILVETVGVGQSEFAVSSMVDLTILLHMPSTGDEIQGMKRGILEVADFVVISKADGTLKEAARLAKSQMEMSLSHNFSSNPAPSGERVFLFSLHDPALLVNIERGISEFFSQETQNIQKKRLGQYREWFQGEVKEALTSRLLMKPPVLDWYKASEEAFLREKTPASLAARALVDKLSHNLLSD